MDRIVKICKALGDESRVQLINLLLQRSYCVKALAKQIEISPSAVSQHLKILKEAGLVTGNREGYWVHYEVKREQILFFLESLEGFFAIKEEERGCCRKRIEGKE